MNTSQSSIPNLALICAILLLAACGGSGGGGGSGSGGGGDNQASSADISFSSDRAVTVIAGVGGNPTGDAFWDQTATKYGIGDFNNDGLDDVVLAYIGTPSPDIITTPHTEREIKILLQNGAGGLYDATDEMFNGAVPATHRTRNFSIADFNGDGQDDIFLGNHGIEEEYPGTLPQEYWGEADTLLLSVSNGKYTDSSNNLGWSTRPYSDSNEVYEGFYGHYTHGSQAVDFQNDGDIDILLNTTTGAGIVIMVNQGDGTFVEFDKMPRIAYEDEFNPGTYLLGKLGALWSHLVDVDNDGDLDLISISQEDEHHAVFLNVGGSFQNDNGANGGDAGITLPQPIYSGRLEYVDSDDIDGDGNVDLFVQNLDGTLDGQYMQILMGNGDGTFADETNSRTQEGKALHVAVVPNTLDLNNDGKKDIVSVRFGDDPPRLNTYINVDGIMTRIETGFELDSRFTMIPIDLGDDNVMDLVYSANGVYYITNQ